MIGVVGVIGLSNWKFQNMGDVRPESPYEEIRSLHHSPGKTGPYLEYLP